MAALLITDKNSMLISRLFFIIFLAWIFLFPQPVQERYQAFVVLFLAISFLASSDIYSLFKKRHLFLWVFLFCAAGNVFNATDKSVALRAYLGISLSFLFLYFISYSIFLKNDAMTIVAKFACGLSILICLIGVSEWISGRNFIYKYYIDNIYYERYINSKRLMSTQLNPVILGSFLIGVIPFVVSLLNNKSKLWRIIAIVGLTLNVFVIVFSPSRGVFLGFCSLFVFYLWNKKKVLSVVFVAIVLLFISLCSSPANTISKILSARNICFGSQDGIFSEYRSNRLLMTLRMVKDHPFLGVGFKHFRIRFKEYKIENEEDFGYEFEIPDNMYLSLFSETGALGLSGFIIFIFHLLRMGSKAFDRFRHDAKNKEFLLLCMSGAIGLLVNMAGYDMFYWYNPFALFCILCGAIAAFSSSRQPGDLACTG